MDSSDLYSKALSTLTRLRLVMLSLDWQKALDRESEQTRLIASHTLIQVQQAIIAVSNASLGSIAVQMNQQKSDLSAATEGLTGTLDHITAVTAVLTSVAKLIGVVGKIVPFL